MPLTEVEVWGRDTVAVAADPGTTVSAAAPAW